MQPTIEAAVQAPVPGAPRLGSATRVQLQAAIVRRKTMSHLRLGDALIQERLISVEQRDAALARQAVERGRMLGEILVDSGAVTAEVIRRVLVDQLGVPSVHLASIGCEPDAIAAVSATLAWKYMAVPLYRTESRLAVAIENPLWWEALRELESATGLVVDSAMAPRADLLAVLAGHYGPAVEAPMPAAEAPDDGLIDLEVVGVEERLRVLSARVLSIQEEERHRISRDLHDDVGQSLTALRFALFRLAGHLAPEGEAIHSECVALADSTIERVRQLACEMRPPQLDELGLEEALRWLVERQRAATGLDIKCHFNGLLKDRLPAAIETACYRITQEALSNATRHADASSILVAVEATPRILVLTIRDDGRGLRHGVAARERLKPSGLGLISMAERASLACGQVAVSGEAGQGTTVRATFDLERGVP